MPPGVFLPHTVFLFPVRRLLPAALFLWILLFLFLRYLRLSDFLCGSSLRSDPCPDLPPKPLPLLLLLPVPPGFHSLFSLFPRHLLLPSALSVPVHPGLFWLPRRSLLPLSVPYPQPSALPDLPVPPQPLLFFWLSALFPAASRSPSFLLPAVLSYLPGCPAVLLRNRAATPDHSRNVPVLLSSLFPRRVFLPPRSAPVSLLPQRPSGSPHPGYPDLPRSVPRSF